MENKTHKEKQQQQKTCKIQAGWILKPNQTKQNANKRNTMEDNS